MMIFEYDISSINPTERDFFKDMLSYASEHIVDYKLSERQVSIEITDEKYYDVVVQNITLLYQMVKEKEHEKGEQIETKLIFDSTDVQTTNTEPIYQKLLETKNVISVMPGVYEYSYLVWNVCKYFTRRVKKFLQSEFPNYIEIKSSELYPLKEFEKSGSIEKFPHHLMFQTVLKNNIKGINEFSNKGVNENFLSNIQTPHTILKTASCISIYPMVANNQYKNLQDANIFYVTGKCFRNEGDNVKELSRLNEFTMSEIVFIGTDELIRKGITRAKKLWEFWIKIFNLNCKIETANDSFFAGNYRKLKYFQLLGDSKEEFKWLLPHSKEYIATASANYHRTQFTKRFNIESDKGYCHSACIAFGIERLMYAFLCQKGIDLDTWDQATIDELSEYITLK